MFFSFSVISDTETALYECISLLRYCRLIGVIIRGRPERGRGLVEPVSLSFFTKSYTVDFGKPVFHTISAGFLSPL